PPADDHHVRTREVADEMSRVAHARERLRDPGHVLDDHMEAAEHEEEASGDEVLRKLAVVRTELGLGIRFRPQRRLSPREQVRDRTYDDRQERRVGEELQRREVLEVHARAPALAEPGLEE